MRQGEIQAVPDFKPSDADIALERELEHLTSRYNASQSRSMKRALWRRIQELHKQRSPQMVAMLEARKGLS